MTRPAPRRPDRSTWWPVALALLALVVVGLAGWQPKLAGANRFWFDDYQYIERSEAGGRTLHPERYLPWTGAGLHWLDRHRPLGRDLITLMLRGFGDDPLRFHRVQLGIHLANVALLGLLLAGLTRSWLASVAGASLLVFSPSAYHPVLWTSTLFDSASAVFALLATLAVLCATRATRRWAPACLLAALVMQLAAAKMKEDRLVLGPLLVLFLFWFGGRARRRLELAWAALAVGLSVLLLSSLGSTVRQATGPEHAYYTSMAPSVIARSLGYYFALLLPLPDSGVRAGPGPISTLLVVVLPLCAGLLLRSRLMLFGWLWYLGFLLPPSMLKNHYAQLYYPYAALLGAALAAGGLVATLQARSQESPLGRRAVALGAGLFACTAAGLGARWLHAGPIPAWHERVHAHNGQVLTALRATLPTPTPGSEIVLVIPGLNPFSHDAGSVLRVEYRDPTLRGRLFEDAREADAYARGLGPGAVVLVWEGQRFRAAR